MFRFRNHPVLVAAVSLISVSTALAQDREPHPWDIGSDILSKDVRLTAQRHTDTRFEMTEFGSLAEWEAFAEDLRFRIRFASGLWPEPERTPLNARVFDPIEREDYTIYKVHFEAYPGFLVTGNLYKPKGEGPFPGILNPHGHWEHGRFENTERASVPARCITFARMGMVAFTYDMVGYNDSKQLPKVWGHNWDAIPLEERRAQELYGIHPFGVQLWSAVRGLDFLESLPYVDKDRLACTGASGGGTQTFALYAVDDRVKVAAPVNMISHSMQGGDACENAPLIRHNASNMEIGALMAPRPLLMVSATGDWTKDTPEVEYPAIRGIYQLYGAKDRIENVHIDAGHNYNQASREAVYRFFGKWLLDEEKKYADFTEPAYEMEPVEDLHVFPGELPEEYMRGEEMIAALIGEARERAEVLTEPGVDLDAYRRALGIALGLEPGPVGPGWKGDPEGRVDVDGFSIQGMKLISDEGAIIAYKHIFPRKGDPTFPILFVHPDGAAALADTRGVPRGDIQHASNRYRGRTMGVVTVFGTGERASDRIRRPRFADTFVRSDDANRVLDIMVAAFVLRNLAEYDVTHLRGIGEAEAWCALAAAARPNTLKTAVELGALPDAADVEEMPAIPLLGALGGVAQIATVLSDGNILFKTPDTLQAEPVRPLDIHTPIQDRPN